MMAKQLYKRIWRPPSPTIDHGSYGKLLQKRKLAELREAVLSGNWQQVYSDDSESDSEGTLSTSCTASPRSGRSVGQEQCSFSPRPQDCSRQQQASIDNHHQQQDLDFELALKAAAEEQLAAIHSKLLQGQAHEQEQKLADKHRLEQQHADTSKQIAHVQERLEELKRSKHELINQLKVAMQAETAAKQQAAAAAQAAQAAAQQAAMQQQQQQQQPQQQQESHPHPALPGPLPLQQQQQQHNQYNATRTSLFGPLQLMSHTSFDGRQPDGAHGSASILGRSSSGALLSPGASGPGRVQRLFSTPQPPPPPPRQQQQQQHMDLGQDSGATAAAAAGPAGAFHTPGAGVGDMTSGQSPGGIGGSGRCNIPEQQQQDLHGLEVVGQTSPAVGGSSGAGASGYGAQHYGSRAWQEGRKHPGQQQQQQQQRGAAANGAPDSPEEGEALPSPKPRNASAAALAAAAVAAGAGAGAVAGSKVLGRPGSSHASAFAAAAADRSFGRSSDGHIGLPDQYGQLPRSSTGRDSQQQQQEQRRHGPAGDLHLLQPGSAHPPSRSPSSKLDARQPLYSSAMDIDRPDGFGPPGLAALPGAGSSWQQQQQQRHERAGSRPHWEDGPFSKGDREEGPGGVQHHQQQWRLDQQRRRSSSGVLGERPDGPGPGSGMGPAGAVAPGRYVMSFSDRERERERGSKRERGRGRERGLGGGGGVGRGGGGGGWW